MKLINLLMLCVVLSSFFTSCNQQIEEKYTGILANDEVISSIKQEIADKENSLLANDGDVFWTESGKLWHKSLECSYLANSKNILHGSVEEAKFSGKEKACSRCFAEPYDSIYESLENNEYKQGDVFFTKEGDTWHTNINCRVIAGAEKIYFASEETAKHLGKKFACEECDK